MDTMDEKINKYNWRLELVPIKKLKEHPKNPRQIHKHEFEHLKRLIAKFGLIDKPIVNADFMIIAGHQRIKILKKDKEKEVECWMPDRLLNEDDVDDLCIGHNLHQGSFDYEILANQWEPLNLLEYGFSEERLLGEYEKKKKKLEAVESSEEKTSSAKKPKCCPACGHEF